MVKDDISDIAFTGTPQSGILDSTEKQDALESTSTSGGGRDEIFTHLKNNAFAKRFRELVTYVPKRCRYDPEHPFEFGLGLNILFAFVS